MSWKYVHTASSWDPMQAEGRTSRSRSSTVHVACMPCMHACAACFPRDDDRRSTRHRTYVRVLCHSWNTGYEASSAFRQQSNAPRACRELAKQLGTYVRRYSRGELSPPIDHAMPQPLRRFPDRRPRHPSVAATESSTVPQPNAYYILYAHTLPSIQERNNRLAACMAACMHCIPAWNRFLF